MSTAGDSRLRRFVNGELGREEIAALEIELDRSPRLRRALADVVREAPTVAESSDARSDCPVPVSLSDAMADGPDRLCVGATIGVGGMGTVRQGVQTNLGRTVAVKMLREDTRAGRHRLLQEARLTARLQHPNIVPVYEIVAGPSGQLQIVLKQVDGVPWASVMHDAEALRARFQVEDALDWNLGVLSALCNALAYAHERGVLHRDVKPTNVMLGNFGEIYLLDWGVAAMFGERTEADLAHVEDCPIAGTLAFMAPEQLEGDPNALGPWTDTYLLGATLYEVLQGKPPHATAKDVDSRSDPRVRPIAPLDPSVPSELVELVEQALEPDPAHRLPSAEAFRGRLEEFRRHSTSRALAEQAAERLRAPAEAQPAPSRADSDQRFVEAEFGFRAALERWPGNVRARDGLRSIAVSRIDVALREGEPNEARRLLSGLQDPPEELTSRVLHACAKEAEAHAASRRAAWNDDRSVGVFVRGALLIVFAPLWVLGWATFAIWEVSSATPLLAFLAVYFAFGTAFVLSRGLRFLRNRINRTSVLGVAIAVAAAAAWIWCAERLALGVTAMQLGSLLLFALTLAVAAAAVDARAAPPAVVTFGAFVLASLAPVHAPKAMAASALAIAASTLVHNLVERRRSTVRNSDTGTSCS